MLKGGRQSRLFAAMASLAMLAGCFAPEVTVLRQPHRVQAIEGKRPTIYLYLNQADPAEWFLDMQTPKGNILLKAGPAIVASYAEGLGGFFYVLNRSRYNDYLAYIDPFTMVFEGEAVLVEGGVSVRVRMHMKHSIPILEGRDQEIEKIPVDASLDETIPYRGEEALNRECARLVGVLLSDIEDMIFEYMVSTGSPGKYRIPD